MQRLLPVLFFVGVAAAWSDVASAQQYVVCESRDERTARCPIGPHREVELVERYSDAGCQRGRDWFVERRAIVVTDGCRARFAVYGRDAGGWRPGPDGGYGEIVRCESRGKSPNSCYIGRHGEVRLVRQLSKESCRQGRDWWVRGPNIEVVDGCRAEFSVERR